MSCKYLYAIAALTIVFNLAHSAKVGEPAGEVGTILELKNGQRVQIFVEEKQLHAYFIDAEGLVIESNGNSIVFVVDHLSHKNDKWRALLSPTEESGFTSSRKLFPPYEFRSRIIVRFSDEDPITLSKKAVDLDKIVSQTVSDDI